MSPPEIAPVTGAVKKVVTAVRELMLTDGPPEDPVDRALAAIALAAGAAVLVWPKGKKLPMAVSNASTFARQVWARRHLFMPGEQ